MAASSPTVSSILEEEPDQHVAAGYPTLSPIPSFSAHYQGMPAARSATPSPPGTPHLSSRPQSAGRMSDRMKRFLRIPSTTSTASSAAGVATSSVQATSPSTVSEGASAAAVVAMIGDGEHVDSQATNRDRLSKMIHQITNPRYGIRSFRRPRRVRRKRSVPERLHYSDDGYTSDPGLLRDDSKDIHDEEEEEDDTESGDPDAELRKVQIAHVEAKLEKTKKLLQEGEEELQETTNAFLQGMESTMSDKAQQRIRARFLTKRPKAQFTITQLRKKVDRYEQQIQILKEGGAMGQHWTHPNWIKGRFSGMKNGIKARVSRPPWKKKVSKEGGTVSLPHDEDDDDLEVELEEEPDDTIPEADDESASFANDSTQHHQQCEYCRHELLVMGDTLKRYEEKQAEIHSQLTLLYNKLHDERDKTERLEGEFNTLTDLHQHEVIELRSQLAQMERVSFSKSQDLEDTLDNCQSRLHKLEVEVTQSFDIKQSVPAVGMARRVFSPLLTVLLEVLAVLFKMSNSIGKRTTLALFLLLLIVFVSFISYLI